MLGSAYPQQDCSLAGALEIVGERWTLLIVRDAFYGVQRFSELQAHLDIPKAVLADRLEGLVGHGILARRPDPEHGGRHLYELTAAGRDLWPVIHSLVTWGNRHGRANSRLFRHAACDTELAADGSCPACALTPPPQDVITAPRPRHRGARREDPVAVALREPHRLLTRL
ncbi:MAG TPA: helix-turn-helix domain-containing protein [Solirubrobacteraceae bacterium]|jgi:DNA-binding HxlR family transcriptional regulator|nr:helix-turn-helix domain-containing protein [Solirubrobacteraceae bacterium]